MVIPMPYTEDEDEEEREELEEGYEGLGGGSSRKSRTGTDDTPPLDEQYQAPADDDSARRAYDYTKGFAQGAYAAKQKADAMYGKDTGEVGGGEFTEIDEESGGESRAKTAAKKTVADFASQGIKTARGAGRAKVRSVAKPQKLSRKQMQSYVGGQKMSTYYPIGMRSLTQPHKVTKFKSGALAESVQPNYGRLRQESRFTPKPLPAPKKSMPIAEAATRFPLAKSNVSDNSPLAQLQRSTAFGGNETLTRMRRLTMPKGLNEAESEAWLEIKENGDIDVPSHVVEELEKIGIDRNDARRAITSLQQKGLVKPKGTYQGEPVLAVARSDVRKA